MRVEHSHFIPSSPSPLTLSPTIDDSRGANQLPRESQQLLLSGLPRRPAMYIYYINTTPPHFMLILLPRTMRKLY